MGTNLFWLRAANDNDPGMTKHDAHDALDFIGLTVPLTFDGVKVTPWGMGGIIGQDSFKGSGPDMTGIAMPGMLPSAATRHSRFLRQGSRQHLVRRHRRGRDLF